MSLHPRLWFFVAQDVTENEGSGSITLFFAVTEARTVGGDPDVGDVILLGLGDVASGLSAEIIAAAAGLEFNINA